MQFKRNLSSCTKQASKLKVCRSSYRSCSIRTGVLRNFEKFSEKHLRQNLFFNKDAGLRPAALLKERLQHRRFSENFTKFLKAAFLQTSGRLLLSLLLLTQYVYSCLRFHLAAIQLFISIWRKSYKDIYHIPAHVPVITKYMLITIIRFAPGIFCLLQTAL